MSRIHAILVAICTAAGVLAAGQAMALPGESAYSRSLARWESTYWRWTYGQLTLPTDEHGNAVVGDTVMMPLPEEASAPAPASIDVTIDADESFVLPLWASLGTSYDDGTAADPLLDLSVFRTLEITFKIDGVVVINDFNKMSFYSQSILNPPIPLADASPVSGIVWIQAVGFLGHPLPEGRHTLTLDVKNVQPAFGSIFEFHNTWNVTVQR